MKLGITGHRPDKMSGEYFLNGPVSQYVREKLGEVIDREEPDELITGMALGADMIMAQLGIARGIKVFAAIPCDGQEDNWSQPLQELYYDILESKGVKKYIVCPGPYATWKLFNRNKFVVERANKMVAVWNGDEKGGTYETIKYTKELNKELFLVDPNLAFDIV